MLAGVVVADFVRRRVDALADQMALDVPLGRVAQAVVLVVAVLTALAQLEVSTGVITAVGGVALVLVGFTAALAFGLGSREVAGQLAAGRYVGGALELGQTIRVGDVRVEIVAFDSSAVVLRDDAGATVRVPNRLLLESVVTVESPPGR